MTTYFIPIYAAVQSFVVISILAVVPYALFQYIRYGSVSKLRTLILGTFVFYMLSAWYLTILPLPDPESVRDSTGPFTQLIPFHFVYDFITETKFQLGDIHTWLPTLTQGVFYEPLFNIALTTPFGIYLATYFRRGLATVLILTFMLTLFYEFTQLSALYGLYPKPYRLFDVDDIMLNTLGGLVGYLIAQHLPGFIPSRARIDEVNLKQSQKVGYCRRIMAFVVDYFVITLAVGFSWDALGNPIEGLADGLINNAVLALYFVLCHCCFGRTLGKLLVHIRLEPIRPKHKIVLRYVYLYAVLSVILVLNSFVPDMLGVELIVVLSALAVILLLILADFLIGLKYDKRLLYERINQMYNVNTKRLST